jgi:hypothetical protein
MKYIPDFKPTGVDKKINYAQSWNLAVALVAPMNLIGSDTIKKEIERLQEYFYDKLYTEPYMNWGNAEALQAEAEERIKKEPKFKDTADDDAQSDAIQTVDLDEENIPN